MHHFTGKDDIPGITLTFDGTGFDGSFQLPMQLDFDRANLGETNTAIMGERKTTLRIGEAVIAAFALKTWVARITALSHSTEKGVKRFPYTPQHVLQHLRIDIISKIAW